MSEIWNTKYGRRRVRFDPPTLREAIVAAQGLTGDLEQQAEIAAALIAAPIEDVRTELLIRRSASAEPVSPPALPLAPEPGVTKRRRARACSEPPRRHQRPKASCRTCRQRAA